MATRIGFVDYKLENFHANVFLKAYHAHLKSRGATVAGCTSLEEDEGRAWATKNDVPYFDDPTQLNGAVDCYMILAPSNPEKHLELCQRVFQFGKPTYVDKTFAPDLATARTIFDLADKHNVPVQTTSALRYTNVQLRAGKLLDRPELADLAQRQLDWILGVNPFNASTVTGAGRNQPKLFKAGEFKPPTPLIPGGVMNGLGGTALDGICINPGSWNTCEYWTPMVAYTMRLMAELRA